MNAGVASRPAGRAVSGLSGQPVSRRPHRLDQGVHVRLGRPVDQRSSAWHTLATWSSGSIAPVLTVPALAATQNGRRPAARSAVTAARSAPTSIRKSPSTGTVRTASAPSPRTSAAFRMQLWPSSER
jgi:hypothetical protein